MNGGMGPWSYTKNSSIQRGFVETTKQALSEEIIKKLDISQLHYHYHPLNSFHVADFGCSTGPNTFEAIKIIVEAIKLKYNSTQEFSSQVPEFQVFFSDVVPNDFNTLFSSLPPEREYYTSGVPGSFYGRLLPKDSLHFAYSSSSLNWLSEVPRDILDKNSPAWNKKRIHYSTDQTEVLKAYYFDQFGRDLRSFLEARAMELVDGGLMCLVMPGSEKEISLSQTNIGLLFEVLETCLMNMANMSLISEENVASFKLPTYFPTLTEMETLIKERGSNFVIERMEMFSPTEKYFHITHFKQATSGLKAAIGGLVANHFGTKITDLLFELLSQRFIELADNSLRFSIHNMGVLFFFLKRANRM